MGEKRYSLGEAGCYYTKLIIDNKTKHELGNSIVVKTLNEQQVLIERLKKDNDRLQQLVDVSMKADEVFSVFDDLKYIESALTFLIDNGLEDQCVECEREDIHFVAERLRIVLRSLDNE